MEEILSTSGDLSWPHDSSLISEKQVADDGPSAMNLMQRLETDVSQLMGDDGHDHHADLDDDAPVWTELKTKAGKDRKRLPLACISCRRKKIKCSGEKPACKHCVKARTPCVYKTTMRKPAPRTDYMMMLDRRLKRMEDRVMRILPSDDLPDVHETGRSWVRPPRSEGLALHENLSPDLQNKRQAFRDELDNWAHDQAAAQSTVPTEHLPQFRTADIKLSSEGLEALPSAELQLHLAEVFFDCVYGQSYLLLHKPSLMRKLKSGAVPPVLILAICAVAARFSTHPQLSSEPAFLRGEQWATPARKIVEQRHFEPNITILTVMVILGLHYFGTCEGGLSWSFGGQAMRMAHALQLHKELRTDSRAQAKPRLVSSSGSIEAKALELSSTDREIRRRTMWACLLLDVFNSSGTERPPFLDEEYISIQLPLKESLFQTEIPGCTKDLQGRTSRVPARSSRETESDAEANMGVAAYVIRAVVLWKKIIKYLNLGGRENEVKPPWDPSSRFAMLLEQVTQFKHTLPASLMYSTDNLAAHSVEKIANQFLFLHTLIAQNSLFLHRFAVPTYPNKRQPSMSDAPRTFLSDSMAACLEAAAQISTVLADSSGHSFTVPFAGYCAYTSATVHIWALFGSNEDLRNKSKVNLRHNIHYLNGMKRHWGMMHYMVESIKDTYRAFADAAHRTAQRRASRATAGPTLTHNLDMAKQVLSDSSPSEEHQESLDETVDVNLVKVIQYSDWFEQHPTGVSRSDWEREHRSDPSDHVLGTDAVMSQRSELQSVEEFFASLLPSSKAADGSIFGPKGGSLANRPGRYSTRGRNIRPRTSTNPVQLGIPSVGGSTQFTQTGESITLPSRGHLSTFDGVDAAPTLPNDTTMEGHDQDTSNPEQPRQDLDDYTRTSHADAGNIPGNANDITLPDFTQSYNLLGDMGSGPTDVPSQLPVNFNHLTALPQVDRWMVFDGCTGIDPSSTGATNALNHANDLEFWTDPWSTQIDMDGFGGGDTAGSTNVDGAGLGNTDVVARIEDHSMPGFSDSASSAWFMPFNIDPPDAEDFYTYDNDEPGTDYGIFDFTMGHEESDILPILPFSPVSQP